jgi:hypothetical protein
MADSMKNRFTRRQFLERSAAAATLLLAQGPLPAQSTPGKPALS